MPSPHSWEIILANGNLVPELRNHPDEYDRRVEAGMARARDYLEHEPDSSRPTSFQLFKQVHGMIFADVYVDAGETRSDFIQCGRAPWHTAHPPLIDKAMNHLQMEVEGLLQGASTDEEKAHAVTYQTSQAWRLQPFNDGNTRTVTLCGRALAQHVLPEAKPGITKGDEFKMSLGNSVAEVDLDESGRLVQVSEDGHLGPLCKSLTGIDLPEKMARTPNRENYAHEVEFELPSGEKAVCMAYGNAAEHQVEDLALNSDFGPRLLEEAGRHPFPLPATIVERHEVPQNEGAGHREILELDEAVFERAKQLTVVHEVNGQELRSCAQTTRPRI